VCGIVGILARDASVPPGLLERATQSLAHRGPDDHGTIIVHATGPVPVEVGLGNRRLAILDLSSLGHQPMHDPETGNWIVHNGEVYNFRDVRAKLENDGVRFTSQSDTEVVLKAYGQWGERCLQEFRGMFAFAIWDAVRRRLFVARDPMGIKPLYYYQSEKHFLFASEVRTLLSTGLVPRRLDEAGVLSYLTFGSAYEPTTLVEGLSALPPGHYLTWGDGKTAKIKYWDLAGDQHRQPAPSSQSVTTGRTNSVEQIYGTLDESVRMQLVSDVPVGVFLSGGIDSSSLVGILSRRGVRPSTFSIVFREADYSEAQYSRAVAEQFKTDHHEVVVSQHDALEAIPAALRAMDQPTMDGINTYFVSQQTRAAGVKVALSGLGGDEMFAGYSSFHSVPQMERFARFWKHFPGVVRGSVAGVFGSLAPTSDQNRKLATLIRENGRVIHPYFLSRMLFTPAQRSQLSQATSGDAGDRASVPLREAVADAQGLDAVNRISYLESRCYMLNTLLRDSDVMSMAHGLEVRVPLIDHRLAEQLMTLPGASKLSAGRPKPLLLDALRGTLPANIVQRPKRGFTLPFEHWMRDALRPQVEGAMKNAGHGALGSVLNPPGIQLVWHDFLRGATSWSRPWSLFVLRNWCEQNL
jgi:asparagine synthase (glutamine-hydrolysing)